MHIVLFTIGTIIEVTLLQLYVPHCNTYAVTLDSNTLYQVKDVLICELIARNLIQLIHLNVYVLLYNRLKTWRLQLQTTTMLTFNVVTIGFVQQGRRNNKQNHRQR